MPHYEYKVVPAPTKGEKTKGVKTPEGRFAHTVESELNRMGGAGWEYVRAELLPSEERSGLKSTTTQWRTVLIFRREREMGGVQSQPFEDDAPLHQPRPWQRRWPLRRQRSTIPPSRAQMSRSATWSACPAVPMEPRMTIRMTGLTGTIWRIPTAHNGEDCSG